MVHLLCWRRCRSVLPYIVVQGCTREVNGAGVEPARLVAECALQSHCLVCPGTCPCVLYRRKLAACANVSESLCLNSRAIAHCAILQTCRFLGESEATIASGFDSLRDPCQNGHSLCQTIHIPKVRETRFSRARCPASKRLRWVPGAAPPPLPRGTPPAPAVPKACATGFLDALSRGAEPGATGGGCRREADTNGLSSPERPRISFRNPRAIRYMRMRRWQM